MRFETLELDVHEVRRSGEKGRGCSHAVGPWPLGVAHQAMQEPNELLADDRLEAQGRLGGHTPIGHGALTSSHFTARTDTADSSPEPRRLLVYSRGPLLNSLQFVDC